MAAVSEDLSTPLPRVSTTTFQAEVPAILYRSWTTPMWRNPICCFQQYAVVRMAV
jgi:hypothetical protein